MLLRSYLLIYRKRLIVAAIASVLCAILVLFITSADSPTDIGVLWHHVCGCPLYPRNAGMLVGSFNVTSLFLSIILGMSVGAAGARTPGLQGNVLFLLTRPQPRRSLILQPLLVVACALAILPALGWLVLLGWLKMVHAPSLGYLAALAQIVPSASHLGPHPSFLALLLALNMGRRYLAAFSVELSFYAFFAAQRWLLLNPSPRLRVLGSLQFLVFMAIVTPAWHIVSRSVSMAILLWSPPGSSLSYLPSNLGIMLHFALAGVLLYGSWKLLQRVEL
jgi:hypothetical protein